MQGDDVGLREDFLDGAELGAEVGGQVGGQDRVVGEDLHVEAGETLDEQAADVAEAEDADGLAGELTAHEALLLPFAGAGGLVGGDELAVGGEDQGDDFFRDGVGVRARGVHDVDAELACVADVDVVETGAGADDQLQVLQSVHDLGRDLLAADDDRGGVGVLGGQIGQLHVRVLDHGETVFAQDFFNDLVEFGGNEDFSHACLLVRMHARLRLLQKFFGAYNIHRKCRSFHPVPSNSPVLPSKKDGNRVADDR